MTLASAALAAALTTLAPGEFKVEPLFRSAALHWGSSAEAVPAFEYRRAGDAEWRRAWTKPYFDPKVPSWRTMLLELNEGTDYEVRVVDVAAHDGGTKSTQQKDVGDGVCRRFRTWASEVPIAKTVYIDPATKKFPIVISERGKPDGWIRYTMKPGEKLVNEREGDGVILLQEAKFVVLDDVTIVGGPVTRVVELQGTENVRVRNCDVSGFGWPKTRVVDKRCSQWSAGIHVHQSCRRTVVECCYVHDPVGNSIAWRYYHPYGPMGICVGRGLHETVLRYNDVVGGDHHRWDDAIISNGNFTPDGGLGLTAEVYGNFTCFPNDDNIELDGAQSCVACFRNRFEGGLVGISIQGNVLSPSYVFGNVVSGQGDEFGECGQLLKTSGFAKANPAPYTAVLRNVFLGDGRRHISPYPGKIDDVDNFFGGVAENCARISCALPERPVSFQLDTARIDVGRERTARQVRIVGGKGERFRVRKGADCDWFTVTPVDGALKDGATLTVTFDDAKMQSDPTYCGAFLVRTDDGYSRPVTVYATTAYAEPVKRSVVDGAVAVYADVDAAVRDDQKFRTWEFMVPRDGRYCFMACAQAAERPDVWVAVNDEAPRHQFLQTVPDRPVWGMISNQEHASKPDKMLWGGRVKFYDFSAGQKVRLRIKTCRGAYDLKSLVLTDDPLSFEPTL